MPKLPRTTPKKVLAALLQQGFFVARQRVSHAIVKHPDGRRCVIPMHAHDLPLGTLKGMLEDLSMVADDLGL